MKLPILLLFILIFTVKPADSQVTGSEKTGTRGTIVNPGYQNSPPVERYPSYPERSEILDILDLYEDYFLFMNQPLPSWVFSFKGAIRMVERINRSVHKPEVVGQVELSYDYRTGRVISIGQTGIEYDFRSGKISKIGDIDLLYAPISAKLVQIGPLRIEYNPVNNSIRKLIDTELN